MERLFEIDIKDYKDNDLLCVYKSYFDGDVYVVYDAYNYLMCLVAK